LFRLALELGKTVRELETGLSSAEFDEWAMFEAQEPFGYRRHNMHAGIMAAASIAPHVRKGKKPPTYRDFMLKDAATAQSERKAQTPRTIAALKAMAVKARKKNG
jgi:hypothetical protein